MPVLGFSSVHSQWDGTRSAAKDFFGLRGPANWAIRIRQQGAQEQDMAVGATHHVPYAQAEVPGLGRKQHRQGQQHTKRARGKNARSPASRSS